MEIGDALSRRATISNKLDGISQQYHSLKSQYTDKVSQLEICLFKQGSEGGKLPSKSGKGAEEFRWVVKEGVPLFVRALFNSSDFGAVNATLQTSAIQLGLHQACIDMKEKYHEELKDKGVLFSYPDAQRQIIDCFPEMTSYKYSLLSIFGEEGMDVVGLKKLFKVVDFSKDDEVGSC
ncbi:unnamed protein product [Lactuca virosa]|uniref:Uncharacterized protein n=1 Tax=Lactuca virosa TaxID=75947 RepID=A0AAU9PKM3_9ASTR|nr:unnamed protein product [Lactuca virosa]